MATWVFDDEPINIGIDVGWSERKKSCALAVEGLDASNLPLWRTFRAASRIIAVCLFRLSDLRPILQDLLRSPGFRRDRATIVVDGPIGANGLATTNRMVDSEFGRGVFNGRMQPSPVEGGSGPRYADVTDRIVRISYEAAGLKYRPGWWDGCPVGGFTCCETHPTVGLALSLPPQEIASLPTRRSPRRMAENSKLIRAKSDWYWQLGAGCWVAETLMCPPIGGEDNHERVAGLYCLAVANRLAAHRVDAPTVVSIGNDEGVYVLPCDVDPNWVDGLTAVGIRNGQLCPRDHAQYVAGPKVAEVIPSLEANNAIQTDESDDAERGDSVTLILNDNGGVWEQHNDWLVGLDSPVCLKPDSPPHEIIRLVAADGDGQWMAAPRPLPLARNRGFQGQHLSNATPRSIPCKLVDCD